MTFLKISETQFGVVTFFVRHNAGWSQGEGFAKARTRVVLSRAHGLKFVKDPRGNVNLYEPGANG